MKLISTAIALSLMLFSVACDDDDNDSGDTGPMNDASTSDASTSDASTSDASTSDASTSDASTSDASTSDASADGGTDIFANFSQIVEGAKSGAESANCKSWESKDHCGGNPDGEWKLKEVCGGAGKFEGMLSWVSVMFPCEAESDYRVKMAEEMKFTGETYSSALAMEAQIDFTFRSDCFANEKFYASSCDALSQYQDKEGNRVFESCSGTNSECKCRMPIIINWTESGNLEIDENHMATKPTYSSDGAPENNDGDFCVDGDRLFYWSDDILSIYTH